jgi:hypothetical protein
MVEVASSCDDCLCLPLIIVVQYGLWLRLPLLFLDASYEGLVGVAYSLNRAYKTMSRSFVVDVNVFQADVSMYADT